MLSGLILIGRGLDQKYREKEKNIDRESLRNQRLLMFIKIDEVSIKVHYMVLSVQ